MSGSPCLHDCGAVVWLPEGGTNGVQCVACLHSVDIAAVGVAAALEHLAPSGSRLDWRRIARLKVGRTTTHQLSAAWVLLGVLAVFRVLAGIKDRSGCKTGNIQMPR
jgi:hypothetical protein